MPDSSNYDVIIVGGGHAGTEAAAASARMGARTLLFTQRLDRIGELSCNPSIGGIGKGHLVREIDALDGIMARAADQAGIHFKLLNRSKGPAVRGLRAQVDRATYRQAVQDSLATQANLECRAAQVEDLAFDRAGTLDGVILNDGSIVRARSVVITTGTFLRGVIHVGHTQTPAGRVGEAASVGLALTFERLGFVVGRLKTGTPPRLDRKSVDWDALQADAGDLNPEPFSFLNESISQPQIECRITGTTPRTHDIVRANLKRSAMYGGAISGRGPRYCPSLEDKVVRFGDRDRHQIFLEPEGLPGTSDGALVYPNGISTSLPADIQAEIVSSIPGLKRARIVRPGYAVEYDFIQPTGLQTSLESRTCAGLFLAGQINGTTGYEEAAAQGIIAGINAACRAGDRPPILLDRASSYLGVLVDDLTRHGVSEPYRMFTSRSEYRLSLRCDNADLRLSGKGNAVGCISPLRAHAFNEYAAELSHALALVISDTKSAVEFAKMGFDVRQDGSRKSLLDLLAGGSDRERISNIFPWYAELSTRARAQLASEATYRGYVNRQDAEIRQLRAIEALVVPTDISYGAISGLSTESRERLELARPRSLGDLARIAGLTPVASLAVMAHLRRHAA